MAEVEYALYGSCGSVVNHPLKVFKLEVCYTHVAYYTFITQFHKCGQGLINHLLQAAGQCCLELYVMYVDKVYMVYVEAFHALIDTFRGTLGAVVPGVHSVLSVTAYLG